MIRVYPQKQNFCIEPPMEDLQLLNIKRILLADDDDDDFNLFNSAILSLDPTIEILRTDNGIMLASIIETSIKPDIIIIDINMPFRNGIDCLKEIRNKEEFNDIKVIIYSTSNHLKDVELCYNLGADFYLVKPMTYNAIIKQMKDLFNHKYLNSNIRTPRDQFVINTNSF